MKEGDDEYVWLPSTEQKTPHAIFNICLANRRGWQSGDIIFSPQFKQLWLSRIDELDKAVMELGEVLEGGKKEKTGVVAAPHSVSDQKEKMMRPEDTIEDTKPELIDLGLQLPQRESKPPIVDEAKAKEKERVKKMMAEMQVELEKDEKSNERKRLRAEGLQAAMLNEKAVEPLTRKDWLQSDRCLHCAKKFSVKRWSHHCRNCAGIFCYKCCSQKTKVPGHGDKDVRICVRCWSLLLDREIESTIVVTGDEQS